MQEKLEHPAAALESSPGSSPQLPASRRPAGSVEGGLLEIGRVTGSGAGVPRLVLTAMLVPPHDSVYRG